MESNKNPYYSNKFLLVKTDFMIILLKKQGRMYEEQPGTVINFPVPFSSASFHYIQKIKCRERKNEFS